jgi:malonyl CoA-acyl carrier protein transacylase
MPPVAPSVATEPAGTEPVTKEPVTGKPVTREPSLLRTTPGPGWDTEVFLLRGENRADLRDRVLSLAAELERQPTVTLTTLAARLAGELAPGGFRLGIVAATRDDLRKKLLRAAERLADANCRQLRDSAGVYFTSEPLHGRGTLAVLYPGEGAQYAGMLADLCRAFPEVAETFDWCDRIAAEAGQPSLRHVLHPAPEDRGTAEAQLRRLGPSIFGVLIADLALTRVLTKLEVPVSAVAGHSAGELAALLAAGAMQVGEVLGPRLAEISAIMERLEDESGGPDVVLLAVGAGKAVVQQIAAALTGGAVIVAMDNCPHQCVAVGPTHLVAAVEAALLDRGLVCERLPFRRPYHTPLFEPWMRPFRELFAAVPFGPPAVPVYSCSTGRLFPDDPEAIRDLAVNHWVKPVEFTRMIETMYADGVRVFVEAGPRGNLSAFVEDILRGRPFVAVPANVARRSGPTQINQLVAQLAVHHVPLNLGCLFAGRTDNVPAARTERRPVPARCHDTTVVSAHLDVMERFLDVQREVMEAYLSVYARAGNSTVPDPAFYTLYTLPETDSDRPPTAPCPSPLMKLNPPAEANDHQPAGAGGNSPAQARNHNHHRSAAGDSSATPGHPAPTRFCLIEQVVRHEPGRSLIARRTLDIREDIYADDHTLGGRGVSRVDPKQNGLPVLPMTFSLEAMAQAAVLLVPGKVVTTLRNVRLYRWVPFDPQPTTLEVRVSVAEADPMSGAVVVRADVRDLGNSFLPDGANKPASEATLVLADSYPPPPAPLPFRLTDERRCRSSIPELRRNMFHGPLFQMLRSLDRYGPEGIEGTLEVHPRDGWFRSNPAPHTVLDPVLVDAAMHILGAWHLEQPDWSGRILLPIGLQSLEFFGPPPPVGSRLRVRGHNEGENPRQIRHGLEVFGPDGGLWYRLTGATYWRFYLPFGEVNFFGPKDQYFLSQRLEEAEAARAGSHARCYFLDPPADLQQPVMRACGVRVSMTPREIAEFLALTTPDEAKSDWFFSRLVAKDAVRSAWAAKHGVSTFPADIEAEVIAGRFVCRPRGTGPIPEPYPPVAVARENGKVAAFAAFAERVGVAVVVLSKTDPEPEARARAARLALADALDTSAEGMAVSAGPNPSTGELRVTHAGRSFLVRTTRFKNVIVATTQCEALPP